MYCSVALSAFYGVIHSVIITTLCTGWADLVSTSRTTLSLLGLIDISWHPSKDEGEDVIWPSAYEGETLVSIYTGGALSYLGRRRVAVGLPCTPPTVRILRHHTPYTVRSTEYVRLGGPGMAVQDAVGFPRPTCHPMYRPRCPPCGLSPLLVSRCRPSNGDASD